jgi:F0F1-type ATP synthase assembly protein I
MPARKDSMMGALARYSGMALTIPAMVVVGYFIGGWLDTRFGTHSLYVVGVIVGAAGGLLQVVRQLSQDSGDGGT